MLSRGSCQCLKRKKTSLLHSLVSPPEIWADNGQIFYRLLSQQSFKIFLSNIHSWSLVAFSLERIKTCCELEEMRSVHPIPSFPLVWFLDLFYLFYFFFLLVSGGCLFVCLFVRVCMRACCCWGLVMPFKI